MLVFPMRLALAVPLPLAGFASLALAFGCGSPSNVATPTVPSDAGVTEVVVGEAGVTATDAGFASNTTAPTAPTAVPSTDTPSAHVEATGCRFTGKTASVALSYDASDHRATFAEITDTNDLTIVLGSGRSALSSVVVDAYALAFDAQLPVDGVTLYPRAPLALGGVYDPDAATTLRWHLGDQGLVTNAAPPPGMKQLGGLEAATACGDVALERGDKIAARAVPKTIYEASTKGPTPLSAFPGGKAVVELRADKPVSVVEQRGQHARITFEDRGIWLGWVPTAQLLRGARGAGYGYGTGGGRLGARGIPDGFECAKELPLFVRRENGEPLARVGTVHAKQRVGLAPQASGPFRQVYAEQRSDTRQRLALALRPGFELVVPASAADTCVAVGGGRSGR